MPYIRFIGRAREVEDLFFTRLVNRGVLMLREHMSYVCVALEPKDIDYVIQSVHDTIEDLKEDGKMLEWLCGR
jgi:glutamate-1-semialdehyde aminotransferase